MALLSRVDRPRTAGGEERPRPTIIDAIREQRAPAFTIKSDEAVYTYVQQMLRDHRVSDAAFAAVRDAFGLPAIVELAGLIGHYVIGAATLNAAEYDLPAGAAAPFA